MNEALALIISYLIGSIPTAYLATRIVTGKDIRKLGGGNVGGLNTYREVGLGPALIVGLVDVGKGVVAVAVAYYLFGLEPLWVMLAGLGAVVGHNWMVWLKFKGGMGMGTALGALAILFPLYGYGEAFWIMFAFIAVPLFFTRNVALSMGVGLFTLPLITWFATSSGQATRLAVVLLLIIGAKFAPTAIKAMRSKGKGALGQDTLDGGD